MKALQSRLAKFKQTSLFNKLGKFRLSLKGLNAIFSVKRGGPLMNMLKSLAYLSSLRLTLRRVRVLFFLAQRLVFLYSKMGPQGLVNYLKTCSVLTQQALGGHIEKDTKRAGKLRVSRTNSGFPRLIPREFRAEIRHENYQIIKLVLSILSVYRVITYPGKPSLNTISAAFTGNEDRMREIMGHIPVFVRSFILSKVSKEKFQSILEGSGKLFPIFKSAPGMVKAEGLTTGMGKVLSPMVNDFSTSPTNVVHAIRALYNKKELFRAARDIAVFTGNLALRKLVRAGMHAGEGSPLVNANFGVLKDNPWGPGMAPFKPQLGKLRAKEEPAGKVRIFAMVDPITQWVLYPLHKAIFACLRVWPMDGTFDQLAPLQRLRFGAKGRGLFSVDLTAATDRLPMPVQTALLAELTTPAIAQAWATLLVDRNYSFFQLGYAPFHGVYRYAIGQPMGALSSWASLAITHHFLVQYSAWRSGIVPYGVIYRNYAVLGDDLVIGDKEVYLSYLQTLEDLGMPVNLGKSIISPKGKALEFAKRTVVNGMDVSPISVRDLISAQSSLPQMVDFMRKHKLSFVQLLNAYNFGWRVKSSLNKPLGQLNAQVRNLYLTINIPSTVEEAKAFFQLGTPNVVRHADPAKNRLLLFRIEVEKLRRNLMRLELFLVRMGSRLIFEYPKAFAEQTSKIDHLLFCNKLIETAEKTNTTPILPRGWPAFDTKRADYYLRLTEFYRVLVELLYEPIKKRMFVDLGKLFDSLPSPQTEFFEMYILIIEILKGHSLLGTHSFELSRPDGAEGQETQALTPSQIRFFRRWSGIVQGVLPLDSLFVRTHVRVRPYEIIKGPDWDNTFVMYTPNPDYVEVAHNWLIPPTVDSPESTGT
jgi:hypothetical protein